ncbi:hypothetical protein BZG05_12940 [Salinivibrio kushneri]|uniref:hypothetical protein n=1 Tax=Salinivibrio kushneri TaxID=1908198 RepID=UPI000988B57A|nr:hypothetical protein [Salinivibrio kushneri]OOE32864.1 hypothetical protein BZG05_12940 [Salinivibrio kushneri]
MRDEMMVIVMQLNGQDMLRVTPSSVRKQAYTPLPTGVDMHDRIEKALINDGIAHNVTMVGHVRDCGKSSDYLVTFNSVAGLTA